MSTRRIAPRRAPGLAMIALVCWSCASDGPSGPTDTPEPPAPPAAPHSVTASAVSHTAVDVTWVDASSNETGFRIEREAIGGVAAGASAFVVAGTAGANVTSFRDGGLSPASTYRYRVVAVNGGGGAASQQTAQVSTHAVLSITTQTLAKATAGVPYAQSLGASGGSGAFTWTLVSGTLPSGVGLQATGSLGG